MNLHIVNLTGTNLAMQSGGVDVSLPPGWSGPWATPGTGDVLLAVNGQSCTVSNGPSVKIWVGVDAGGAPVFTSEVLDYEAVFFAGFGLMLGVGLCLVAVKWFQRTMTPRVE